MRPIIRKTFVSATKAVLLTSAALASTSPALSQDRPAPVPAGTPSPEAQAEPSEPQSQENAASQEGEIIVTGSLVATSGFDMPTPVTSVGEVDLARIGAADISDVINQIPSVRASLTNDSTVNQSSAA